MDKKEFRIFILLFLCLLLSIHTITSLSALPAAEDLKEKIDVAKDKVEDIKENIPLDPEDISSHYLGKEWSKIFENNKVLGPIHRFFIEHPLPFRILFNEPYSFSLTFILIVILWLYFAAIIADLIQGSDIVKWPITLIIGLACALILAQLGLIRGIVIAVSDIIMKRDSWWIRLILWLVATAIFIALYSLKNIAVKKLKAIKSTKEKSVLQQEMKESKAFREGVKEGQDLTKDIDNKYKFS